MTNIIIANDPGTTQFKSISVRKAYPGKQERVEFESVLGESKDLDFDDPNLMEITTEAGHWFVGRSAETYSGNKIWGKGGLDWYLSPHYLALHLYAIAQHVAPSANTVEVDLISALPRADYLYREQIIEETMVGSHIVETGGRQITIYIRDAWFAIQGWAAIMADGYTPGSYVAWLGLGGRNKTYATINREGKVLPDQTDSVEGGLLSVVDRLAKIAGTKYGVEMSKQEWIKALETKRLMLGSGAVDISEEAKEATEPYTEATFSLISDIWNPRTDLPFITDFRIGGGGAFEIGDQIAGRYQQARVVDGPRWAEAVGLMELGKAKYISRQI